MKYIKTTAVCIAMLLAALLVNLAASFLASAGLAARFSGGSPAGSDIGAAMDRAIADPDFLMLVTLIATCAVGVLFVIWYRFEYYKRGLSKAAAVYRPANIIILVLLGLFLQLASSMLLSLLLPLFEDTMREYEQMTNMIVDGKVWISVLAIGIAAPIAEECAFRGVILGHAQKTLPFAAANILQALLFAVYHLNIVQGIYTFFAALVFGYVVHRYKRLVPSIILHASLNLSSYVIEYLLPEAWYTTAGIIIIGVISTAAVIFLCTRIKKAPEAETNQAAVHGAGDSAMTDGRRPDM